MSEIKLKPCPFCGGEAVFAVRSNKSSHHDVGFDFTILCSGCQTRLPAEYSLTAELDAQGYIITTSDGRKAAAEAWNRREGEQDEVKRK